MKKRKTYIVMAFLIAAVVLGVGYAAISNINLNINGSASATPSDENFKVKFIEPIQEATTGPTEGDNAVVLDSSITNDTTATFTVSKLNAKDQTATFVYTVKNESPDLSAALEFGTVTNTNTEYFSVEKTLGSANIAANGTTTVTVVVTLIKTPINDTVSSTITIPIVASPVTP